MNYLCPVCFYPNLSSPPADEDICPCCGTEFGYDDYATSHHELRRRWIQNGAPWFSQTTARPEHWSPLMQVVEGQSALASFLSAIVFPSQPAPTALRIQAAPSVFGTLSGQPLRPRQSSWSDYWPTPGKGNMLPLAAA